MTAAGIGAAYRAALAGRRIAHEGRLDEAHGLVLVAATDADGATLMLRVRPVDHVIEAAAHHGAAGPVARTVLDALCAEIEGLPIQEASDHGAIRLEFALRHKAAVPVPGVVTPGGADPAFRNVEAWLRRAMAAYREITGHAAIDNDFDAGPAAAWRALPRRARLDRLMSACAEVCQAAGWPENAVAVADIEYDVRVVVELRGPLASGDCEAYLMRLERAIKDRVDPRLELYLAELSDANALRRLSEKRVA